MKEEVQNEGAVSCEGGAKWRTLSVVRHKMEGAAACEGGEAQSEVPAAGCREPAGQPGWGPLRPLQHGA